MNFTEHDLINTPLGESGLTQLAKNGHTTVCGLINPKSTVFKKMNVKLEDLDDQAAIKLVEINPRILMRPLIQARGTFITGFSEAAYQQLL